MQLLLNVLFFAGLVGTSATIFYQDTRYRLIDLWAIVGFTVCSVSAFLINNQISELVRNLGFTCLYFILLYLLLKLYYLVKTGSLEKIINEKVGAGDIFIAIPVAITMNPSDFLLFFSVTCALALLITVLFSERGKTVPFAAHIVCYYVCFKTFAHIFLNFS